jgi:hypothetical protein
VLGFWAPFQGCYELSPHHFLVFNSQLRCMYRNLWS